MTSKFKVVLLSLLFFALFLTSVLYVVSHDIAVLNPKGMIGKEERELIITASLLMLIVVIPVFIFTLGFAWKYRENAKGKHEPDWEHNSMAEYCWWGVPFLIILILAIITWKSSHTLSPFRPIASDKRPVVIQVVALNWKWLFLYPEEGVATVNFVQFPEKTPVNFEITADAPMNSFWIPQLGGQIYAMPAMRSKLHLIADEEGIFRGSSANLSGTGFALMVFTAKASSEESFQNWISEVKSGGKSLDFETYRGLVLPTENHPIETFSLQDRDLFEKILMQYMRP